MDWIWIIFIYLDFFAQSYLYHYKKKIKISVGQKPIVCIKIDTNYYFCVSQATALKLSQMCLCPSKEVVAYQSQFSQLSLSLLQEICSRSFCFFIFPLSSYQILNHSATHKNKRNFQVTDNHSRCLKMLNAHINAPLRFHWIFQSLMLSFSLVVLKSLRLGMRKLKLSRSNLMLGVGVLMWH